jgi:hypothetical protein
MDERGIARWEAEAVLEAPDVGSIMDTPGNAWLPSGFCREEG